MKPVPPNVLAKTSVAGQDNKPQSGPDHAQVKHQSKDTATFFEASNQKHVTKHKAKIDSAYLSKNKLRGLAAADITTEAAIGLGATAAVSLELNQISDNEPESFLPGDQNESNLERDLALGDASYIENPTVRTLLFGAGVAAATGAGALGLINGLVSTFSNRKLIQGIDGHFTRGIQKMTAIDVASHRKEKVVPDSMTDTSADELAENQTKKLKQLVIRRTILAGTSSGITIAGALLGLAFLFPPAFIPLAALSLTSLVLGFVATGVITYFNVKQTYKILNEAKEKSETKDLLKYQASKINNDIQHGAIGDVRSVFERKLQEKLHTRVIESTRNTLLGFSLVTRLSSLFRFALPVIGMASSVAFSSILLLRSAISGIASFLTSRHRMANLAATATEALIPNIDKRRWLGFGNSYFNRGIKNQRLELITKLGLDTNATPKNIRQALGLKNNAATLRVFRQDIAQKELESRLLKFAIKNKLAEETSPQISKDPEKLQSLIEEYTIDRVAQKSRNQVLASGFSNTFFSALAFGSFGLIFPPFTAVIIVAAFAGALLGFGVSTIIAFAEGKNARKNIQVTIYSPDQPNPRPLGKKDDAKAFQARRVKALVKTITASLAKEA